MALFWKKGPCTRRFKLTVYHAILRSKLLYSLDSLQVNDNLITKINAFHLKGIRQIMRIKTTYIDRTQTNEEVLRRANEEMQRPIKRPIGGDGTSGEKKKKQKAKKGGKPITCLGKYLQDLQVRLLTHIINSPDGTPLKSATFKGRSLKPNFPKTRRAGRPKRKWAEGIMEKIWDEYRHGIKPPKAFDITNKRHRMKIKQIVRPLLIFTDQDVA